jgi:hypothetical protein
LLKWPAAVAYALLSYLPFVALVPLMQYLDRQRNLRATAAAGVFVVGLLVYLLWVGRLQYRIGARAGYWSDTGRRIWRIFAVTAIVLVVADVLLLGVAIALLWFLPIPA